MRDIQNISTVVVDPKLRYTLVAQHEGFSALVPIAFAPPLVAALASEPASLEQALIAADNLYHGVARYIISAVIAQDRRELLWRQGYVPPPSLNPERDAWAITNPETARLAQVPSVQGLIWCDLAQRMVRYLVSPMRDISFGEVKLFDGRVYVARSVTYDLRGRWDVAPLATPRY